jgi:hypothetical protein
MRADEAITLAFRTLIAVGKTDWTPRIVRFTDHPKRYGLSSSEHKRIDLNYLYLDDDKEIRETVAHEVGHALTVGDNDHGLPFQAALIHVRKVMESL